MYIEFNQTIRPVFANLSFYQNHLEQIAGPTPPPPRVSDPIVLKGAWERPFAERSR